MTELLHRTFTPDLEVRSSAQGGDGRTICGIAVPYNQPMRINDRLVEQFAPGAFNAQVGAPHRIRYAREHVKLGGSIIGKVALLRDDAAGLYSELRVSKTPAGDETLELVRDGVITDLSIGFREGQNRRLAGGVIERVTASLFEIASVMEGAYGELAAVSAVRSAADGQLRPRMAQAEELLRSIPQLRAGGFWAITEDAYEQLRTAMREASSSNLDEALKEAAKVKAAGGFRRGAGGVAVIQIRGAIRPRGGGLFALLFGGASTDGIRESLRTALADEHVTAIVLDIDSPGGVVDGVPELADEIRAARNRKPIVAVANAQAASAAYWLAAQANELYVTPSGDVGSIGVFMAHEDWSRFDERLGVKTTLIHAGEHKVDGNPFEPLSDDARADWQQKVDDYYGMFVTAVARGRGVKADKVRADYGQGRTLLAARAIEAGMADRIGTLDDALRRASQLGS